METKMGRTSSLYRRTWHLRQQDLATNMVGERDQIVVALTKRGVSIWKEHAFVIF